MTAEERNRRMKWGSEITRLWIPDFNMTHQRAATDPTVKAGEVEELIHRLDTRIRRRRSPSGPPPPASTSFLSPIVNLLRTRLLLPWR